TSQSRAKVTAAGCAPAGRVICSGSSGSSGCDRRSHSSAAITSTPTPITTASAVTRRRSQRSIGNASSGPASGLSSRVMAEILITIPEGLSERLDKALALAAPEQAALSRSRLAKLIADGAVTGPSGPVADGKARAETGDYLIRINEPEPLDAQPEAIPLSVAHEDEDLIVVDKPAGMVVHPA